MDILNGEAQGFVLQGIIFRYILVQEIHCCCWYATTVNSL